MNVFVFHGLGCSSFSLFALCQLSDWIIMVKMIYEQTLTNKQMDVLLFLQDISECLMTAREEDHLEPKKIQLWQH